MKFLRSPKLLCCFLLFGPVLSGQVLTNGGFSNGLTGWTAIEAGGTISPGSVTPISGQAQFLEGDSFLVELSQDFVIPAQADELRFDLELVPGFDLSDMFIPDAFEASIIDPATNLSLVPTITPFTTSCFNMQESQTVFLGAGTTIDGMTVSIDLSGILAGTSARILFSLIGGDADMGSGLRIDNVEVRQFCSTAGSWAPYGIGWPGTNGIPSISVQGALAPGGQVDVLIGNSAGVTTTGCLGISPATAIIPSGAGGAILIDPYHPQALMFEFIAPPQGATVTLNIPYELSGCGDFVALQAGLADSGASHGYSFTDAISAVIGN